jgi:hypothetical protein
MPLSARVYQGYYHASPECWSVYGEVLAAEFENALLFSRVHQLTVDSYAVQHAGGNHPDKSVCVHLVGLHLVLERAVRPMDVPRALQRLASAVTSWPHFTAPEDRGPLTILDVAAAETPQEHESRVREWAARQWSAWGPHHGAITDLAEKSLATR